MVRCAHQGHLAKLHQANVTLSQQKMVEPFRVEESLFTSDDASALMAIIKQLKLRNFEIEEGQVSRSSATRRKKRSKRGNSAVL